MAQPPKPKHRKRGGSSILILIDRYLVQVSAGLVVGIWLASDISGLVLSQGTQAAMASFLGYALLKTKADTRWRAVELEKAQMDEMVEALGKAKPGSPEALAVRRELVALARQAQASDSEDGA